MLTESEAVLALNSAVKAYDKGKSLWPTMSVAERIACMKKFHRKDECQAFGNS